ncbi:MAG: hypothetical protein IMW97_01390 [Firmicutes bacterium]|nr:hypothetical protein [Candidatus Fermentithermobacillaceae bacterium]
MRKSAFLTFIFSAVPGLGHLYLGFAVRGLTLMGIFLGWMFLVAFLGSIERGVFTVLLAPLPILWVYGLFDALNLCGRLNRGEEVRDWQLFGGLGEGLRTGQKSTLWALLFSVVPGAGHMYLGWQERGLAFMASFFGALFLMDWLHLSFFLFMLPVIWFYSFFDALQIASAMALNGTPGSRIAGLDASQAGESPQVERTGASWSIPAAGKHPEDAGFVGWIAAHQKWVGTALIVLGCMALFDNLVVPLLDYRLVSLLKTVVAAGVLIGAGLRLALGTPIGRRTPAEGGRSRENP